ncbi:hypothetical protein [Bacillus wiedmannii]|uniref:Group-specific protein n=1 Tax=Bacillus wiedmannii TaxID=1890302 RepID=A0ABX5DL99_9BACI|nr:hypothetical protein [Bacillus wiedmannii]PRT36914.1 hypothetical protein C6357_27440 [Bacillus wiedmannii]
MDTSYKFNVFELQHLLHLTYSDICTAYDVVTKKESNNKYQIALGFINNAHSTYLESRRLYFTEKIERQEFEDFFAKYERLERELKEVISEEDTNTSWLYSRHEDFIEEMKSINELVAALNNSL